MKFKLEQEANIFKHSFFIELKEPLVEDSLIEIENAYLSAYAQGWQDYLPFTSTNNKDYVRVNNSAYNDKTFSFTAPKGSKNICWFPDYTLEDFENFLKPKNIDLKYEQNNPYLFIGDNAKPLIVITSRQHPAESMSSFFLEGFTEGLLKAELSLLEYSFLIFPFVNIDGVKNRNHRLTPDGIDINRMWNKKYPITDAIKNITEGLNIKAFIDLHGDEVTKQNYVFDAKGNSYAEKIFSDFTLLPTHSFVRRFLKNLIRKRKIISPFAGYTAQKYFSKFTKNSFTIEFSSHTTHPDMLKTMGKTLFKKISE